MIEKRPATVGNQMLDCSPMSYQVSYHRHWQTQLLQPKTGVTSQMFKTLSGLPGRHLLQTAQRLEPGPTQLEVVGLNVSARLP